MLNKAKNFNFFKKNIIFYEFDTIKHIKNFEKYNARYGRTYYVIFHKKYGTVPFGVNFSKIREKLPKIKSCL